MKKMDNMASAAIRQLLPAKRYCSAGLGKTVDSISDMTSSIQYCSQGTAIFSNHKLKALTDLADIFIVDVVRAYIY